MSKTATIKLETALPPFYHEFCETGFKYAVTFCGHTIGLCYWFSDAMAIWDRYENKDNLRVTSLEGKSVYRGETPMTHTEARLTARLREVLADCHSEDPREEALGQVDALAGEFDTTAAFIIRELDRLITTPPEGED